MCASPIEAGAPVLEVRDLVVRLATDAGEIVAVSGVSFDVRAGETLALVGESGAGKSMSALAVMRLAGRGPEGRGVRLEGRAWLHGEPGGPVDVLGLPPPALAAIRGRAMSMVFQEPMTSLNPVFRVGWQVAESLRLHEGLAPAAAARRAVELLALAGIPEPAVRARAYPHELSGGMRQRAMIALALACRPRLLIADEPTTALDVTVQAQVLDLVRRLQRELGMGVLFITHDLGVVAQVADRVAVLYAGRVVEEAPVAALFESPAHPYTRALLAAMPAVSGEAGRLPRPIPGQMPGPGRLPPGCAFHPRCSRFAAKRCDASEPGLEPAGAARTVRCLRWNEPAEAAP